MKDDLIAIVILVAVAALNFCFGYCMAERRYQEKAVVPSRR